MSGQLDGRVAVVTGAGAGIGRAIARAFVAEGARVLVAELNPELGLRPPPSWAIRPSSGASTSASRRRTRRWSPTRWNGGHRSTSS